MNPEVIQQFLKIVSFKYISYYRLYNKKYLILYKTKICMTM